MKMIFIFIFLFSSGCQKAMEDQPRYTVNGRGDRLPPEGTVPYRAKPVAMDLTVDRKLLERGQERYAIYCSVCHGILGDGEGMVTKRGFSPPPGFHSEQMKKKSDQDMMNVINYGKGRMVRLGDRISPTDQFAIVKYIRVLQLSQDFK